MPQTSLPSAAYADSKPHYDIQDGLRGVAALLVVVFHLCEAHATSHFDQLLNHGYLAVDFFFILSEICLVTLFFCQKFILDQRLQIDKIRVPRKC